MNGPPPHLDFCWWNLHNFAHFDRAKLCHERWPRSQRDYEAKRDRITEALAEAFGASPPHLIAVCETTREAAMDLATRMPGGYQAVVPPEVPRGDGFHVAVLHRSAAGFTPELPIIPSDEEDLQRGTRPMVPVHFQLPGHLLRFVACHWTAFDNSTSEIARQRLADVLKRDCRRFLVADIPKPGQTRHVVILGDLNEEPHDEVLRTRLIGCRDRESSRSRTRWQDEDVQRVRLYNAAWRLLGEQVPHGQPVQRLGAAGTLYNDSNDVDKKGWRTFDHLLVSGSLLGTAPPFLDETETRIVTTPAMRDDDGLPTPFKPGSRSGVSDHLPISGRIVLGRT